MQRRGQDAALGEEAAPKKFVPAKMPTSIILESENAAPSGLATPLHIWMA